MKAGRLMIRPLSAKLTHNTEHFGKMSPYVKVLVGNQVEKTAKVKKGHLNPVWGETELWFDYFGDEMITFEVWHDELILKDDLVGSQSFSLSSFLSRGDSFNDWIPLLWKGGDAGALEVAFQFFPERQLGSGAGLGQSATLVEKERFVDNSTINLQTTNLQATNLQTETLVTDTLLTQPVITTETKVITHEPIITIENPIVYEKHIIHEKPIITERTIIHSEQPIIIEKPELHERIITEQAAPILQTEAPIIRQETGILGEAIGANATIQVEKEFIKDQAEFIRETPIVHQKDVILEKPIIHEKDIIYRERPVIVEKPEIIEKHIYETQAPFTQTHETAFFKHEEFTTQRPLVGDQAITHIEEPVIEQAAPIFMKEMPDVHETQVIHEKRLITEKPIVHTEKEVIHQHPEVHETRIYHQEQTILQKQDPLLLREGINQQPNP